MFRLIAKWFISRAIDCDRPMPAWVERWVAHDPILKQFDNESKRLAARLRASEPAPSYNYDRNLTVEGEMPERVVNGRSKLAGTGLAVLVVGLAATVLLVLVPFFKQPNKSVPEVPTEVVIATPLAPNRVDPEQLRELIESGRSLVQGLKQRAGNSPEPAIEMSYEQLSALANLDVDQVIQPVSDLGTSYGALLTQVDNHVEAENRRLISDGIGTWNFFVHKLPKSAASLVGL